MQHPLPRARNDRDRRRIFQRRHSDGAARGTPVEAADIFQSLHARHFGLFIYGTTKYLELAIVSNCAKIHELPLQLEKKILPIFCRELEVFTQFIGLSVALLGVEKVTDWRGSCFVLYFFLYSFLFFFLMVLCDHLA
jgi:hypothetical protein